MACYNTYFRYCNAKIEKKLKVKVPAVTSWREYCALESTFNGGKVYIDDDILNKPTQCFTYDHPAFYQMLMGAPFSELRIPLNEGKSVKLNHLDYKNLDYGIYNVRITTDSNIPMSVHAKKVFAFNSRNYYTHYCLQFCYEYRDLFGFKIELLHEHKYNAYIYDRKDVTYSTTVFDEWFKYLSKMKKLYPDNPLVKYLSSSLHGTLETARKLYFSDEELNNDELDIKFKDTFVKDQEKTKYVIIDTQGYYDEDNNLHTTEVAVDTSNPYLYNMARIKPFLTAYVRLFMALRWFLRKIY